MFKNSFVSSQIPIFLHQQLNNTHKKNYITYLFIWWHTFDANVKYLRITLDF